MAILVYTILNYKTLSSEKGWGVVEMAGLAGVGVVAGLIDFGCQRLYKNTTLSNTIGVAIIVLIVGTIALCNLPFQWTRKSDINFGNKLIDKIEIYRIKKGRLPETDDWRALEELGFKMKFIGTDPAYTYTMS